MSRRLRAILVAVLAVALGLVAASAAKAGDAASGGKLAAAWCSSCHATGAARRATDMAPPFVTIANDPVRTPTRLRVWLADPHPPMPNLSLSNIEIDDILAWLDTLKRP